MFFCKIFYTSIHVDTHGPLTRYMKLWDAHTPGMPTTFSLSPPISDPNMHHGTCMTHVQRCTPGSLTGGFLWSRWRGKRSRHSVLMCNPQFHVSKNGAHGCEVINMLCFSNDMIIWLLCRKDAHTSYRHIDCNIHYIEATSAPLCHQPFDWWLVDFLHKTPVMWETFSCLAPSMFHMVLFGFILNLSRNDWFLQSLIYR